MLAGTLPDGQRVVVADWGGDPGGLDAAEVLAAAGKEVTLAVAPVAVGEHVHQYRRNLYLQRLYRAGVRILHHHELARPRRAGRLRNVFAPELSRPSTRTPSSSRSAAFRSTVPSRRPGIPVESAGDCLSPRSLEEAILEGTLAARRVFA